MQLLTDKQKLFLSRRDIKVGGFYSFPTFGFDFYTEPNYSSSGRLDTNPFTKSLANEFFIVKEIVNDDFCKGNFQHRPKGRDFYITKEQLSKRDSFVKLLLSVLLFLPFLVYNLFTGKIKKTVVKENENITLLGKKGFGYYVQLILVSPFWLLSLSTTKKSWKEFKYGLIKHKCEYDYDKPIVEKSGKYEHTHFNCKHYGCNIVSMTDIDGNFDFDKDFNKNGNKHHNELIQVGCYVRWNKRALEDKIFWSAKNTNSVKVKSITTNEGIFKGERTIHFETPIEVNRTGEINSAFECWLERCYGDTHTTMDVSKQKEMAYDEIGLSGVSDSKGGLSGI